jgi:hypothetical protein
VPRALLVLLVALAACGGKKVPARADDPAAGSLDAGAAVVPAASLTTPSHIPTSGRPRLHLSLRSTPSGAAATIDGRVVGTTPVRWEMEDDGRVHDFAFTMHGYEPWRLRFSPSHDGVVHAPLRALPDEDAGADQGSTQ